MATAPDQLAAPPFQFRPMTADDVPLVMLLEHAAYQFPWSEQVFRDCLRVGYDCWIVDSRWGVSGYGVMSMGAGECHILNLCIARQLRRCGAGRALLRRLLHRAREAGVTDAFLEVRPSNRAAIALYEHAGFERVGLRRGYYQAPGGREDAIVYRLDLTLPR